MVSTAADHLKEILLFFLHFYFTGKHFVITGKHFASSSSSRVYFNCTTYIHVYIIRYERSSELIIKIIKQAVFFTILLYNLVFAWLFSRFPARP